MAFWNGTNFKLAPIAGVTNDCGVIELEKLVAAYFIAEGFVFKGRQLSYFMRVTIILNERFYYCFNAIFKLCTLYKKTSEKCGLRIYGYDFLKS